MSIERDAARISGGVMNGLTTGGPIALIVENRDWKNWQRKMSADPADRDDAITP